MPDVKYGAFAGLRNTIPAERLEPGDLAEAVNVDIDNAGQAARRLGTLMQRMGPTHSLWAHGGHCLFVQGDTLHRLHMDYDSSILATGLTPDQPASYVEVNGRIYWSNGMETGVIDGGANRSWGMAVPDMPGLTPLAGTLAAGQYQVALTHLRADGQESGTGMAALIALGADSGLRITWNAPLDPDVVEVGVYLTEPNGKVLYQAGVADAPDGVADVTSIALSLPCDTQWLDAPPAGQCLAYHRGRIYIAAGAHLFATAALGYEHCDLRDYIAIDDSAIRFVAGVEHGLFVGTEQQVYFLMGDRLEDMTLKAVVDGAGVARSVVAADGFAVTGNPALSGQQVVLFATALGVCMGTGDGGVVNLTGERYRFDAGPTGAALLREGDVLSQYLLFMPA